MMEDRLQEELLKKYQGKKVKEDCTDWDALEDEELLEASSTIDDGALEITIRMSIQIDLDGEDRIDYVSIGFHTSCWGDSGLGEEDPEEYWTYGECFRAAEKFIENLLE